MNHPVVNFVAFQICWFASCLGAAAGAPYAGPVFAAVWLPLHIAASGPTRHVELGFVAVAALLGYMLDSLLVLGGWMAFPEYAVLGAPSTAWMVTLWMGFAATLRHALRWLRGRYVLGAVLGAALGPLAYWGGSKLGAVSLVDPTISLLAVSVEWLVAMPLLLYLLEVIERTGARGASRCGRTVGFQGGKGR